jgi:hypothetical protein
VADVFGENILRAKIRKFGYLARLLDGRRARKVTCMTSEAHILYDAAALIAAVAVDMPIPGAIVSDVSVSEARALSADGAAVWRWLARQSTTIVETEALKDLDEFRQVRPAARVFPFEYAAVSDVISQTIASGGRVALYVERTSNIVATGSHRDRVRIIKISGSLSAR